MLCQRSQEIEQHLETVLVLIRCGRYSTQKIAAELRASFLTVFCVVTVSWKRGHDIRAEKQGNGWRYILNRAPEASKEQFRRDLAEVSQS